MIEKFIKEKKPFAIIQYYVWLHKMSSEKQREYEIIFLDKKNVQQETKLKDEDIRFFRENIHLFKKVISNLDGTVYEFMDFKKHLEVVEFARGIKI